MSPRPHPDTVERIITEAVAIEQEFLTDADLMCQYIELFPIVSSLR